jgi:hypothetical protein
MVLRTRINGYYRHTPFFRADIGAPVATPRILSTEELEKVMSVVHGTLSCQQPNEVDGERGARVVLRSFGRYDSAMARGISGLPITVTFHFGSRRNGFSRFYRAGELKICVTHFPLEFRGLCATPSQ